MTEVSYLGGGGGSGSQEPSGKWKMSWTLIWVVATQVHARGQVLRAVYLRGRSFTAFTLHLKTCSKVYFQNIYLTSSFSVFFQPFSHLHENISRMICTPLIILNRSYAEHLLSETRLSLETPMAKFSSHCFHTGRQQVWLLRCHLLLFLTDTCPATLPLFSLIYSYLGAYFLSA